MGGSFFSSSSGSSTPSELQPLVPLQVSLSKSAVSSTASAATANAEYDKMNDPNYAQPTPPVLAARLSQLLRTLANAENSVSESVKSRWALIEGLEKLLETNRLALTKEQSLSAQLSDRKADTEAKKREVEDRIMKGLSSVESSTASGLGQAGNEDNRPTVEALTPPPVEAITPVGSPKPEARDFAAPMPASSGGGGLPALPPNILSGIDLSALMGSINDNQQQFNNVNGANSRKRKADEEEDYARFAGGDLDADVAELLAQESGRK